MQDIKIKSENGKFRLRVSGIIINDNKLLVHETQKFIGFCLPGGHVEIGENTEQAIIREIKKELNINVEILELFCINENIYNNDDMVNQEINYYYKLKTLSKLPKKTFSVKEIDKGIEKEHTFHWIKTSELFKNNFKPEHIGKLITNELESKNNIILSDNRKI